MALTFQDVCEELLKLDETTLLEVLDISSEELVNNFQDKIEDNIEELTRNFEESAQLDLFNQDID